MTALNPHVTGRDDWATATFDTATRDGTVYAVTGMVRLWFGVHKRSDGWWRLTHLPTGYGLGEARTEGQLVRAVAEIKDLVDWDFSDPGKFAPEAPSILIPVMQRHNAAFSGRSASREAA